jgi:transposase
MSLEIRKGAVVRIALEPIDFRRSIDGLAKAVGQVLGRSPVNREVFLFTNRRRTSIKALYWTGNGFVLLYKRLERGRFTWPTTTEEARDRRLQRRAFQDLLDGLTLDTRTGVIASQSQSTSGSPQDTSGS